MLYALAISSNQNRTHWTQVAMQQLGALGNCEFSPVYQIPCRQDKGADYFNFAALLETTLNFDALNDALKQLEQSAGRIRPSHDIPLDIDIIAFGEKLDHLQLVASRLPLPFDAVKPLSDLWGGCPVSTSTMPYKIIDLEISKP